MKHFSLLFQIIQVLTPNTIEYIFFFLFRHLDLSMMDDKNPPYEQPNQILTRLVTSLPSLSSLDLSGTTLAGTGVFENGNPDDEPQQQQQQQSPAGLPGCDIPGLQSRVASPLEFLGLYKTAHEAACRKQIPALKVR